MTPNNLSLREATIDDIPALLSLLLTSFRRFPLFDILYDPLHTNLDYASDTIYFWHWRLKSSLRNDPSATIIVAEVDNSVEIPLHPPASSEILQIDRDSWDMLRWVNSTAGLSQSTKTNGKTMVGFAVWKWEGIVGDYKEEHCGNLMVKAEETIMNILLWLYKHFYTRKDQNVPLYKEYLLSEAEMEKQYHRGSFLLLDNLCTDFRMMGLGIGTALVRWGIESASAKGVPMRTETTENNQAFYEKLGFLKIGEWIMNKVSDGMDMTLPIMEWS